MNISGKLKEISEQILSCFHEYKVGQGLFLLRTIRAQRHDVRSYYTVVNILLFNGCIDSDDGAFFKLTQNGYDFIHGDAPLTLSAPPFSALLYLDDIKNNGTDFIFNELWQLIGKEDEALFYIDGPTYYNVIKDYIQGSYPTYSDYIAHLRNSSESTSRVKWYRALFSKLQDKDFKRFLDQLSDAVNNKARLEDKKSIPFQNNTPQQVTEIFQHSDIENQSSTKDVTVFISYTWDDQERVRQIADRLEKAGIKILIDQNLPWCRSCKFYE